LTGINNVGFKKQTWFRVLSMTFIQPPLSTSY